MLKQREPHGDPEGNNDNLWAATTRQYDTENLSEDKRITDTYQEKHSRGGVAGEKKGLKLPQVTATWSAKWLTSANWAL